MYNQSVTISVRADSELDNIIAILMTKHGNTNISQISCNFRMSCVFTITVNRDMMPKSKVIVYYIKEKDKIFKGHTIIETKDLSENYVSFKYFIIC